MLMVIAAWLIPLTVRAAGTADPTLAAYLQDLLFGQTIERYARPSGHLRPPWYFLGVMAWAWIPITPALPWLVPAWRRRLKRRDARYLVLLGWILLVLIFFSASGGKRGVYILPATPALALATAPLVPGLLRLRGPRRLCLALVVVLAAAATAGAFVAHASADAAIASLRAPLAVLALGLLVGCAWAGIRRAPIALAGALAAFWTVIGLAVYPALDPIRSGRRLMRTVAANVTADEALAIVGWREQMILQATQPITHFGYRIPIEEQARAASLWLAGRGEHAHALVPARALAPCFAAEGPPFLVDHRESWYLLTAADVTGRCRASTAVTYTFPPAALAVPGACRPGFHSSRSEIAFRPRRFACIGVNPCPCSSLVEQTLDARQYGFRHNLVP